MIIMMKRLSFLSVNCKSTRDLWYLFYFQFYHNFILDFERIFCCVYLSICMFSFENYNRKNISSNVNVNETVNQTHADMQNVHPKILPEIKSVT